VSGQPAVAACAANGAIEKTARNDGAKKRILFTDRPPQHAVAVL